MRFCSSLRGSNWMTSCDWVMLAETLDAQKLKGRVQSSKAQCPSGARRRGANVCGAGEHKGHGRTPGTSTLLPYARTLTKISVPTLLQPPPVRGGGALVLVRRRGATGHYVRGGGFGRSSFVQVGQVLPSSKRARPIWGGADVPCRRCRRRVGPVAAPGGRTPPSYEATPSL
eukprot:scaffold602_cov342-Prasinococcus_capsulatus_cf.AAC.22